MSSIVVSKFDTKIYKSLVNGIVVKRSFYNTDYDKEVIYVETPILVIPPDNFEISVDDPTNKAGVISKIIFTINTISPKMYDMIKCPICGEVFYRYLYNSVCTNIDCSMAVDNEQSITVIGAKILLLNSKIDSYFITEILTKMVSLGYELTVTNVINYTEQMAGSAVSNELLSKFDTFLSAIYETSLANFLLAIIGKDNLTCIQSVVTFYEDRLITMIKDMDTVFAQLQTVGISQDIRILIATILNSNKSFISKIVPSI